jgi:protein SCO1/2
MKGREMMKRKLIFGLTAVLLAIGLAGCGSNGSPDDGQDAQSDTHSGHQDSQKSSASKSEHASSLANANWQVAPFRYTDENGKPFGMSDLKGKVWLTDMIFTNCNTVCPPMTAEMSKLQDKLKKEGLNTPIVSFSVDPKRDTEKDLKAFGEKFDADFSTWHFLTGYSPKEIKQFVRTSFKSPITKYNDSDQFAHSTSFFLVNGDGKVMAKYDGLKTPFETVIKDIKTLQQTDGKAIATGGHAVEASASPKQPLDVNIVLNPDTVQTGQPETLMAVVSQGDKKVNDADEVMFEVWKKGKSQHQMVKGESKGNGTYVMEKTFDDPGTYFVMSHVTARGQHVMPKKKITVGK